MVIPVMVRRSTNAMMQRNLLTASRSCGVRLRTSRQVRIVTAENVAGILRARSSGLGRADLRHGIPLGRRRSYSGDGSAAERRSLNAAQAEAIFRQLLGETGSSCLPKPFNRAP